MRIGVLGGTFDPIHIAHLLLAEQAREQLALDVVLFIPAGDPWRKAGREVAPAAARLAMTRLAVEPYEAFEVDDCEVRRAGPTYTVETLRELHARYGGEEDLFLVLGGDALSDLPYWHDPSGIAEQAMVVVAPRRDAVSPESLPFPPERVITIEMPDIAISSTDLRQRARYGRSLRFFVPDAVALFIEEHGLYQEI